MPDRIKTREGELVPFDRARITDAVLGAAREAGRPEDRLAERVTSRAVEDLAEEFAGGIPGVEDVQDAVERALMEIGLDEVARRYVVYRRRRAELREAKRMLGVRDELKLTLNAAPVLAECYLRRDDEGELVESTGEMMDRVAAHVASAEAAFEGHRSSAGSGSSGARCARWSSFPTAPR
jgi:ribonucleoside-diphosphate reductase alpha chain